MIGIKLKNFQEIAVDLLFEKTMNSSKKTIILKSPTGSGKTIVLVSFVEKYLDFNKENVVCWFSPGKGELEEQSREKMMKFVPNLNTGNLQDVLNSGFVSGTTYFINWEIITKKDNTAIKDSERKNLFDRIAEAHRDGKSFIVIIDEEHQNNTSKAEDIINALSSKKKIRVSATPTKNSDAEVIEIKEIDVINEELITRFLQINYDLNEVNVTDIRHETDILLEKANEIRKQISDAYLEENEDIRPLVLVQFPNMNDQLIEYVENKLNSMGFSYENKLLASWFSPDSSNKESKKVGKINIGTTIEDSITNNNAAPVFLLFKQALATGWDCPRAKVLVKLRENMNEVFEIQTLGRLRRMPKAKHYGKEILDCSYLYTFDEKYKEAVLNNGEGYETQRLFLKDGAKSIKLKKELRNQDGNYNDESAVRMKVYEFFKAKYNLTGNREENKKRIENNKFIMGIVLDKSFISEKISTLNELLGKDHDYGHMTIEVNTHIHGIDMQHCINEIKKLTGLEYNKTAQLLRTLFLKGFGNKKYKLLNLINKEYYAFIINNIELLKIDFKELSALKSKQLELLHPKTEDFSIPLEEHYRFIASERDKKILEKNVYKEYNKSMITDDFRSMSERLFEKECEKNENIEYVYKNGDTGQQYLSIVYATYTNKERLFYPDYIVKMKDGTIWLIETKGGETKGKSKNIDIQVENKFEVIKNFANKHGYKFGFVRDKNEELYINTTEYVEDMNDEKWEVINKIMRLRKEINEC